MGKRRRFASGSVSVLLGERQKGIAAIISGFITPCAIAWILAPAFDTGAVFGENLPRAIGQLKSPYSCVGR